MKNGLPEALRLAAHRIRQRRWLVLAIAWALCLAGWLVAALLPGRLDPVTLGAALGVALVCTIMMIFSLLTQKFATLSELEKATGLPVLGIVAPVRAPKRGRWFTLGAVAVTIAYLLLLWTVA